MTVSDTLIRAFQPDVSPACEIDEQNLAAYVHSILDNLPISDRKLKEVQMQTEKDADLRLLKKYTLDGWLPKHDIAAALRRYYSFREEISYHIGVLLKGDHIIMPPLLRKDTLRLFRHRKKQAMCSTIGVLAGTR